MPDFAPDVTPRYVAKYHVADLDHNIMVRFARGTAQLDNVAEANIILHGAFAGLAAFLCEDFVWQDALYIPQDTNISVPADLPDAVTGLGDKTEYAIQDKITHLTVSGKGTAGGRVHWQLYGYRITPEVVPSSQSSDFVFHPGENAGVDNARAAFLRASIRTVDGTKPALKGDVTYKVNDFWLKRARKGGIGAG